MSCVLDPRRIEDIYTYQKQKEFPKSFEDDTPYKNYRCCECFKVFPQDEAYKRIVIIKDTIGEQVDQDIDSICPICFSTELEETNDPIQEGDQE